MDVNIIKSKNNINVVSGDFEVKYTISQNFIDSIQTDNFSVWITLPIAMRKGEPLHINGSVSQQVIDNAVALSRIWSLWLPELFQAVKVTASNILISSSKSQDKKLMLFSGGVDSTYSLYHNFVETSEKVDLLTVHGMDYKIDDQQRFDALLNKTKSLRDITSNNHYLMKSNATSEMRKYDIKPDIGHGFHLFSCLFLFEGDYSEGLISADFSEAEEYLCAPWGTNKLTNDLFFSESFSVRSLGHDVCRAEKTAWLSDNPLALKSLSFCTDYKSRPENCGVCRKCMRTKANFYASTGNIPEIFLDNSVDFSRFSQFDLSKRIEQVFAISTLSQARKNGYLKAFKSLEKRLEKKRNYQNNSFLKRIKRQFRR